MSYQYRILALLAAVILVMAVGCKESDPRLMNKTKALSPRWAALDEKHAYLERNMQLAEKRFEQDFAEIEGLLKTIPDSLRGRNYRGMLKDYENLIPQRDTLRFIFDKDKKELGTVVADFHKFEQQVIEGNMESEPGMENLRKFQEVNVRLNARVDSVTHQLDSLFGAHNTILKDLSKLMEIFTNYNIRME